MSSEVEAPVARSPLHDRCSAGVVAPAPARALVRAEERWDVAHIFLRGRSEEAAFRDAVESSLSLSLPVEPCTTSTTADAKIEALWISPDEWILVVPRTETPGLALDLTRALGTVHSQVVDNSGGTTEIIVSGSKAADALAHAMVYDLRRLVAGRVVGTTFGKAAVVARSNEEGYALLVRRSFAPYVWDLLARVSRPYGFAPGPGPLGAVREAP